MLTTPRSTSTVIAGSRDGAEWVVGRCRLLPGTTTSHGPGCDYCIGYDLVPRCHIFWYFRGSWTIWVLLKITQLFSLQLIYFKILYKPNKALSAVYGPPAHDLFGLIGKHFNGACGNPSDEFILMLWNRFILVPKIFTEFLLSAQAAVEAMTDNLRNTRTL